MQLIKIILVVMCFLFLPIICESKPIITSISGSVSDSGSLTISGSSFTSHDSFGDTGYPYLCSRFDNFDQGEIDAWWNSSHATTDNNSPRPGSTFSVKHTNDACKTERRYSAGKEKMFLSMWMYLPGSWDDESGLNAQSKLLGATAAIPLCEGSILAGKTYFEISKYAGYWALNTLAEDGQLMTYDPLFSYDNWHRLDLWTDTQNNKMEFKVDNQIVPHGLTEYPDCSVTDRVPAAFLYASFGFYVYNISASGYYLTDDHYINFTRARVEVGDNSVFENSNHVEIQPSKSWTANQITIDINQGSFADGGAYLFVIDSDGVASDGYAITFAAAQASRTRPKIGSTPIKFTGGNVIAFGSE